MNTESLIKGRIAEHIVELLLKDSGYKVIRIAQEGLLTNVARDNVKRLNRSNAAGKVTTAPSFVVIDKDKDLTLVKVKFRGVESSGRNIVHGIGQLQKHWPEAILIVTTPQKPYFEVIDTNKKTQSIEKTFTLIKKEPLTQFGKMVEKFLL